MISAVATGAYPIEYPHLKGKPHWRRTFAVYAALDTASTDITTYDRLIELVEQVTGKKCSRKLIRKWKEERHKLLSQQSALKKAGGRRQRAGGEQWEEDSDLSPLHFFLKEEACTGLGGRDGENLLPPAPCPLPSKAEALVISEQLPENNPSIQNPKSKI